jgi:O-methyltransferase involved in polyketide biosynthesis
MNSVNKTLYIPLYGKAMVSKKKIILQDSMAEKIWTEQERNIALRGKSKSKWLCYNMAMRARIFDDWTNLMLSQNPDSLVLHIGCGLDSRCRRVNQNYHSWCDCDFPDVIEARKNYYEESGSYHMITLNAADKEQIESLPQSESAIIVLKESACI